MKDCRESRQGKMIICWIALLLIMVPSPLSWANNNSNINNINITNNNFSISGLFDELKTQTEASGRITPVELQFTDSSGKRAKLPIERNAILTIDRIPVNYQAFKRGMKLEVQTQNGKVLRINGQVTQQSGAIPKEGKTQIGQLVTLDPNHRWLTIKQDKQDNQDYQTYYLKDTAIYKNQAKVDLRALYVGDRIKLSFDEYDTNFIRAIDIQSQAIQVHNVYKGTIHQIDSTRKTLVAKEVKVFENWDWRKFNGSESISFAFDQQTPIYVGQMPVNAQRIRSYEKNEIYFVTTIKVGKEIIERMLIKEQPERTYYESVHSVDPKRSVLGIRSTLVPYHPGTIVIRNNRLVDPYSMQAPHGKAHFIVNGKNRDQEYAMVIQWVHDGFYAPNFTTQKLYFGRIYQVDRNTFEIRQGAILHDHDWAKRDRVELLFDDDAKIKEDVNRTQWITVLPRELKQYVGRYGYFYVEDNRLVGAHIFPYPNRQLDAPQVSAGILESVADTLTIRNVSRWQGSRGWVENGRLTQVNIDQVLIIQDGARITEKDLKPGQRVYLLHDEALKARVLFID